jgi:hypothetical protein
MEIKTVESPGPEQRARHHGPHLGAVAIVFVVLFAASLFVLSRMTNGAAFPTPFWPEQLARDYFNKYAQAVRIISFMQFGSAIPLGIFTATVASRLRFQNISSAGVNIALFGGFASSVFLAVSGLTGWVLSDPALAVAGSPIRALQLFGFATGGVGHVVTLGLLLAGVSVSSGFAKLMPRWLLWLGLITGVFAEFSSLSLVIPPLFFLIPLGRFPAFIWMIGTGFALSKPRK